MEEEDDRWLNDLAGAILDGSPADLDSAEADASDSRRSAIREAHILARIAAVYRTPPAEAEAPASADDTAAQLTSWGRLTIIEEIGRGAFGAVYRARDSRLDRDVALKLQRPHASINPGLDDQRAASVIEEGRLLARVHHPNVVAIYDADRIAGRVGLTMELIRGRTLEQALHEHGAFSPSEVIEIGIEVCRALAAVHQAGLLHRDIKAQNVMREDGSGRLVLMDFGAGRELAQESDEERVTVGEMAGTPLYLAPEIFEGQPATTLSDLYSVGVLLYHLVTGRYPVAGRTIREVRNGHGANRRLSLREARTEVSKRLTHVIACALEKNPAGRFASADEMARALAAALATPVHVAMSRRWLAASAVVLFSAAAAIFLFNIAAGRDRLLGRPGQPNQSSRASAQAGAVTGSLAVRQVVAPGEYRWLGRPSLDGRYFSFVNADGNLAVKEIATGNVRALTARGTSSEEAVVESAISPDGRWVAYSWVAADGAVEMRLIDVDGAYPRVLVRRGDVDVPHAIEWSGDGTELLVQFQMKDGTMQLALIAVSDGTVRVLKDFGLARSLGVTLSPDARFVAYDRPQRSDRPMRDIFIVAADGSGEWPLVEHQANDLFPQWSPDGQRVFFASDRTGALGLWMVRVADGRAFEDPQVLAPEMGHMSPLGVTRDDAFFYHLQTGLVDVYTAAVDLGTGTISGKPEPVSPNHLGSNISSGWSPDGRALAYVSVRSPAGADRFSRTLVIRTAESIGDRELWPALAFFMGPRWSPDGRTILVHGIDLKGHGGIHLIDVESGRVRPGILPAADEEETSQQGWTSDGRAITYVKGSHVIMSRDIATGTNAMLLDLHSIGLDRVMPGGNGNPTFAIAPDGRSMAFSAWVGAGKEARSVIEVLPFGGIPTELIRSAANEAIVFQGWTPDGLDLLFTRQKPGRDPYPLFALCRIPLAGGGPRPLGLELVGLRDVHVNRQGTRLTFTAGWATGDARMMENVLPR